jgi:glycosyltransferase involved in cell wall biosynthesis
MDLKILYKEYSFIKKIAMVFIKKFLKYGFVCNEEAVEIFKKYKFHPKVKKVWWGVDIENFKKEISLEEIKNLKQKLGIKENQKVIGYVGRFIEEKGIKDLVEAFMINKSRFSFNFYWRWSRKKIFGRNKR